MAKKYKLVVLTTERNITILIWNY